MTSLVVGLVILVSGILFVVRSRAMQGTPNSSPILNRQAKQYRDAGVVIAGAGAVIVLISLIVFAKGGF